MKLYAIITAAGTSSRMGMAIPKPLLPLADKPIIRHVIDLFEQFAFEQITVTCPKEQQQLFEECVLDYNNVLVIPGGATRAHSIYNGLQLLPDNGLVLVHDGARPLTGKALVERVIKAATEYGAAIPGLLPVDTIKEITGDECVQGTLPRHKLRRIQTPQGFDLALLKRAYRQNIKKLADPLAITDDSSLVERLGQQVKIVPGEESNIKITTPFDLQLAQLLLENFHSPDNHGNCLK